MSDGRMIVVEQAFNDSKAAAINAILIVVMLLSLKSERARLLK